MGQKSNVFKNFNRLIYCGCGELWENTWLSTEKKYLNYRQIQLQITTSANHDLQAIDWIEEEAISSTI